MLSGVNWGNVASWGGVMFGLASAIGYAFAQDWRRAIYFALAAAITVTVIWR
jgi:hypothetical protein